MFHDLLLEDPQDDPRSPVLSPHDDTLHTAYIISPKGDLGRGKCIEVSNLLVEASRAGAAKGCEQASRSGLRCGRERGGDYRGLG